MYIDKHLTWDYHISELSKKLSKANGILSKLRYNAPIHNCLMVYNSIFHTHLLYGCNLWGITSEENIQKIEVLQKKCVRILSFAPFNSHANQFFIDLNILKVRDIIDSQQIKFAYDFHTNRLPQDIMDLFTYTKNIHTTNLVLKKSKKDFFYLPSITTVTYGNKSLRYRCSELWNRIVNNGIAISADVKSHVTLNKIKSGHHLKKTLKKHFLYKYTLME